MSKKKKFSKIEKKNGIIDKSSQSNNLLIALFFLIISSIVIYYNSLHVPFVFDDILHIVENNDIKQLDYIKTKLIKSYRPITYISYAINYHFNNLNTFGYHLFNIFIHISTSLLILLFTRKLLFYVYNKDAILFPFLVSLLFLSHPIHTEVVTYVYNRSASLATMFYFLSIMLFLAAIEKNKNFIYLSLISFALAFFSKETAVTLPFFILIIDYIFISDFNIKKVLEKILFHIPFWIVLAFLMIIQFYYFPKTEIQPEKSVETFYYSTQPWIILKYLKLLLIPTGLCIDHIFNPIMSFFEIRAIISYLFLLIVFIITFKLYQKKTNISKIAFFGILWFFINLLPTTFFRTHTGERHLYFPAFGFCLIIVISYSLISKKELYINRNWILAGFLIIHSLILGILTINRNKIYQDSVLIWQDVILQYPDNAGAYNGRGNAYSSKQEYDKAFLDYNQALKILPNFAPAYYSRGNVYGTLKNYNKAISDYSEAIKYDSNYAAAYVNRGNAYYELKEYDKALSDYNQSIKINPYSIDTYFNRAVAYFQKKNYNKAWEDVVFLQQSGYNVPQNFIGLLNKYTNAPITETQ